jgi:hypothetical protein
MHKEFDKLNFGKSEFSEVFLWSLFFIKKWIHQILLIFYTRKCIFEGGYTTWMCRHVPGKEGWIEVSAGLALTNQTVEPLLKTPGWQSWLEKIVK